MSFIGLAPGQEANTASCCMPIPGERIVGIAVRGQGITIHAIDLKCMTPAQAETAGDTVFHPHAGGTGIHIKKIQRHQNKEREK